MIDELIRQTPCLVILAFVVVTFLRHMEKANIRNQLMAQHCHEVQREATQAINKTAEVIGANTQALVEVTKLLRKLNGHADGRTE